MPKLNLSDKASVREFEREAKEVLRVLAEKWGCTVRAAGGSFNQQDLTGRWTFIPEDETGEIEEKVFREHAFLFGLKPEDYGRRLTHRDGTELMLVGFDMKRKKFPIILRPVLGGEDRIFSIEILKHLKPAT